MPEPTPDKDNRICKIKIEGLKIQVSFLDTIDHFEITLFDDLEKNEIIPVITKINQDMYGEVDNTIFRQVLEFVKNTAIKNRYVVFKIE